MTPSIGRIIHYKLTAQDAEDINRRRTTSTSIATRIKAALWPEGAQAHIGNEAHEGDVYPAIVVRVWGESCINGQAFLDGNDTFWMLSCLQGEDPGQWDWPPRV